MARNQFYNNIYPDGFHFAYWRYLFAALQGVLRYLNGYLSTWTSQRITNDVKFDLFDRLIHMHPQFFDENSSGIIISRYMGDPATASAGIVDNLKTITTSFFGAFGFTVGYASMLEMPIFLIKIFEILLILSILIYIVYLICYLPASILVYAITCSIWSFYKFEEVFKLVSENKKEYIKSALMYFILGIVMEECYRICSWASHKSLILLIVALFVLSCIITYLCYTMSYIVAKINK